MTPPASTLLRTALELAWDDRGRCSSPLATWIGGQSCVGCTSRVEQRGGSNFRHSRSLTQRPKVRLSVTFLSAGTKTLHCQGILVSIAYFYSYYNFLIIFSPTDLVLRGAAQETLLSSNLDSHCTATHSYPRVQAGGRDPMVCDETQSFCWSGRLSR
jgi:hypothetical protein